MKYQTYLAAVFFSLTSVAAIAAEPTNSGGQPSASPDAARGGEASKPQDAGKTTGGQQSDVYSEGSEQKHKTGQASSAEQTDAQGSQQDASKESGAASPEATRKTGEAASARDSKASSAQSQSTQDQPSQANSEGNKDGSTANQQENNAVGANGPTTTPGNERNSPREPANAAYSAELKKCDSLQGNEKDKCIAAAKKKSGEI
jgi:hypothetical protein